MEYPDKEEDPYRYIEARLEEIERTEGILNSEKDFAYRIGEELHEVEDYNLEEVNPSMLRAFDVVCDLLLKRRDNRDKTPVLKIIAEYCEGIGERISDIDSLLQGLNDETNHLETKIISEEIISKMRGK